MRRRRATMLPCLGSPASPLRRLSEPARVAPRCRREGETRERQLPSPESWAPGIATRFAQAPRSFEDHSQHADSPGGPLKVVEPKDWWIRGKTEPTFLTLHRHQRG